jgi:phosphoserine phosphatase RsbU/P
MIAGIGLYNYTHFNRIHGIQEELVRIDGIAQLLQDHKAKVQQFGQHNSLFDRISRSPKTYEKLSDSFWSGLDRKLVYSCRVAAEKNLVCVLDKSTRVRYKLRKSEQRMIALAALMGFKEEGELGRLRKTAHEMESRYPQDLEKLLSFRRHEKDFLMRIDPGYRDKIHEELSEWKAHSTIPADVYSYVAMFDTLSENYLRLYSGEGHGLYKSWMNEYEELQTVIRDQRTIFLQASFRESSNAGIINLVNNCVAVLLAFGCTIFFIRKFSRQIIGLQRSMEQYIASNYQYSDNLLLKIPRNEFGKITTHFLQLTRKIKSDVHFLEDRVARRTQALELKNQQLEVQQKEITESLEYARDLQQSFLVSRSKILRNFQDAAIHYKPKAIVGGDFYWMKTVKKPRVDLVYFALADCTGHGVPGALLSIMGMNALDELVDQEPSSPAELLNDLRILVQRRLNSDYHARHDGMDMAMFCWNRKTNELTFAGAQMPLWLLGEDLRELGGQRMPIGYTFFETSSFENTTVTLQPGERILVFTDGITDQFGGPNDKKLGRQKLRELVLNNRKLSCEQLASRIAGFIDNWRHGREQTDDCSFVILEPLPISQSRRQAAPKSLQKAQHAD